MTYPEGMAVQLRLFPKPSSLSGQFSSTGSCIQGSSPVGCLSAQLQRHHRYLRVYISVPELHFSICSSQGQLKTSLMLVPSGWSSGKRSCFDLNEWGGQCYFVCLIIYLPSYTQHLLSLEWFKHIITSCFSSFITLVCCCSSVRNLSWPLQSRGCHFIWLQRASPVFFQGSRLSHRRLWELHWMLFGWAE